MELTEINNLAALRKLAKKIDAREFIEFADKVQKVLAEVKQQQADEKEKHQQMEEKLKKACESLRGEGFEFDDNELSQILLGQSPVKVTQRTKREKSHPKPPKYKFTNEKGEEKTWCGTGRVPKVIQQSIKDGGSLDEFLIEKKWLNSNLE